MEIIINIQAKKLNKNISRAIDEYIKRTGPFCKITLKMHKNRESFSDSLKREPSKSSKRFLITASTNTVSSPELADMITEFTNHGISCFEFYIGEAEATTESFSISSFALDNEMQAVALTEQLYRAFTILNNITYHK